MNVKRITELRLGPSRMPWSSAGGKEQTLVLEGGEQFSMADRHLAGIVPIVGDWLVTSDNGREIFQYYLIARTEPRPNGEIVLICDLSPTELNAGLRVGPAELNPSGPVPQIGDYLIRKTDGYHVISQRAFEDSYALVLGALKRAASDFFARSRQQAQAKSNRLKSIRRAVKRRAAAARPK